MSDETWPEADCAPGAPHPRLTPTLFGHHDAQAMFLEAVSAGRIHHAWMLTGPQGIGKATLAWRLTRGLLAGTPTSPEDLDLAPDHQVFRQTAALSAPGLYLCRRAYDEKTKRLRTTIGVDEVRKMKNFFAMSATEGGWRIGIIDALDEMGPGAANALLKLLEEPPSRTLFFLVAHQPARLLPTIRSRCRTLALHPLPPDQMSQALEGQGWAADMGRLIPLADGSLGFAHRLVEGGGLALYDTLLNLLDQMPGFDRPAALALANSAAGRGAEAQYDLILQLFPLALARLIRLALGQSQADLAYPGEVQLAPRLVPDVPAAQSLAAHIADMQDRATQARRVNLDPAQVIFDMVRATAAALAPVLQPVRP
ncbi:MAG: DNA polymerase III subunit delta' [Pseudomonadota bacterium]